MKKKVITFIKILINRTQFRKVLFIKLELNLNMKKQHKNAPKITKITLIFKNNTEYKKSLKMFEYDKDRNEI